MDKVEDRQVTARAAASALSLDPRARGGRIFSAGGLTSGRDVPGIISRSAGQPVSRSAGQPVSRSAGQPVSRSAGQPVSRSAGQPHLGLRSGHDRGGMAALPEGAALPA